MTIQYSKLNLYITFYILNIIRTRNVWKYQRGN